MMTISAITTDSSTDNHTNNEEGEDDVVMDHVETVLPVTAGVLGGDGRVVPAEDDRGRGGYHPSSTPSVIPVPAPASRNFDIGGDDDDDHGEGRSDDDEESRHGCGTGTGTTHEVEAMSDHVVDADDDHLGDEDGRQLGDHDCQVEEGDDFEDEDDDDRTSYSYESEYEYDYGDDDSDAADDSSSSSSSFPLDGDDDGVHSSSPSSVPAAAASAMATSAVEPQSPSPFDRQMAKGGIGGMGGMAVGRRGRGGGAGNGGGAITILDDLLRKCDELFPEAMGTGGMDAGEYKTFLDLRSGHHHGCAEGDVKGDGDESGGKSEGDTGDVRRTSPSDAATAGPATASTTTPSSPNRQEGDGDDHVEKGEKGEGGCDVYGLKAAASSERTDGDGGGPNLQPMVLHDGKWTPMDGDAAMDLADALFGGGGGPPFATTTATDDEATLATTKTTPLMTTMTLSTSSSSSAAAAAAAVLSSKRKKGETKKFDMASLVFRRYHHGSDSKLAKSMKTAEEKQREADDLASSILRDVSQFLLTKGNPDNVDAGIVLLSLKMSRGFNRMMYSSLRNLESFADAGERADLYHSVLDVVDRLADGDVGGCGGGGGGGGRFLSGFLLHDLLEGDRPRPSSGGCGGGGSSSCAALLSALAARTGAARKNQESLIRALTNGKVRDVGAEVQTARDAIGLCDRIEEVSRTVSDAIRNGREMGILPPEEEDDDEDEDDEEVTSETAARYPPSAHPRSKAKARGEAVVAEAGDVGAESTKGSKKSMRESEDAGHPSCGREESARAAAAEYCRVMESHRFASVPIVAHLHLDDGAERRDGEKNQAPSSAEPKDWSTAKDDWSTTMAHHYARQIDKSRGEALPPKRLVRIHRELSVLSVDLPVAVGSSIFLRVDEDRSDVMKACVVGPAGTPYENGMFLFDIWLPSDYPNVPPMCHLVTTGGNRVRFNPNLYMDGKVCLSLLGTWSGPSWIPGTSTLMQVLVSIQSLILVPDPYFNEPGMDRRRDGMGRASDIYNRKIRAATLKVAILEQLTSPPPGFEDCVRDHFRLKRGRLLEQLAEWRELAEDEDTKKAETSGDDSSSQARAAKMEIAFRCMDGGLRSSPDEVRELCEKIEASLESLTECRDLTVKRDEVE